MCSVSLAFDLASIFLDANLIGAGHKLFEFELRQLSVAAWCHVANGSMVFPIVFLDDYIEENGVSIICRNATAEHILVMCGQQTQATRRTTGQNCIMLSASF